jgi:hypothetical protein
VVFILAITGPHATWGQAKSSGDGRVVVSGHLSQDMARIGTDMRFWITVENRSQAPLVNLHLNRLEIPGFEKSRWCWGPSLDKLACGIASLPGPACIAPGPAGAASSDEFALCAYLRPREVLTVWGDLKANADLPPHELIALVSWQELPEQAPPCKLKDKSKCPPPATRPEASSASPIVTLGRAEPVASWRYLFRRYTPKAEISIPGALTLLGLFFTWWSGRKEQKKQIWTTMLSKVHDFTMHFYMPIASILSAAISATDDFRPAADAHRQHGTPIPADSLASERRAFYYLMMFYWWQREIFLKVGAYHLKWRTGENLLFLLVGDHESFFHGKSETKRRQLDRVKALLSQETTLDEFLETLDSGLEPDLTQSWVDFQVWAGAANCSERLAILDAFVAVMIYEANCISSDWYIGSPKIELTPRARTLMEQKANESPDVAGYLRIARRGFRVPVYDGVFWRAIDWTRTKLH